ncbi:hypothetical protein SDC9_157553 [bioreactor metagenome]|uniref:Uncharacterized protein n=1 Tax=bioreactor metagenome TaxID=1076179 RepID=A0A645F7B1_9ZZZZ
MQGVGPERVGRDDVAARGKVGRVHGLDLGGVREVPAFRLLAAFQAFGLQHGAKTAVKIGEALVKQGKKRMHGHGSFRDSGWRRDRRGGCACHTGLAAGDRRTTRGCVD